jgi:predicted nucleotidyltransferase
MKPIDPMRAAVLALCQSAAATLDLTPVLIGAFARDIWLEHIHGIETGRATRDVDLTVLVESWEAFAELKKALINWF